MQAKISDLTEREDIKDLEKLHKKLHDPNRQRPKVAYRVLRLGSHTNAENASNGLKAIGQVSTDPNQFTMDVFNHVSWGEDNAKTPNPTGLISVTTDIHVAAWYSQAFTKPVAIIDLEKVVTRVWDPRVFGELFESYPAFHAYIARSAELLIEGEVVEEAVKPYIPEKNVRRIAVTKDAADMPLDLSDLDVIKNLVGTTNPIQVKRRNTKVMYVMKQGRGDRTQSHATRDGGCGQVCAEFFALALYRLAGAEVPDAALYRVRIRDELTGDDIITYSMLTKFLNGTPLVPGNRSAQELREQFEKHVWLDLAIGNFDVCGFGFSNLLVVYNKLYRVDAGCNIAYTASGKAMARTALDRKEIEAFKEETSKKSMKTVSNFGHGRGRDSSLPSGSARATLLGSALEDNTLISNIPDLNKLRSDINDWAWDQEEIQGLWMDMADDVLGRARSIMDVKRAETPIKSTHDAERNTYTMGTGERFLVQYNPDNTYIDSKVGDATVWNKEECTLITIPKGKVSVDVPANTFPPDTVISVQRGDDAMQDVEISKLEWVLTLKKGDQAKINTKISEPEKQLIRTADPGNTFAQIIAGKRSADIVYQDDELIVIRDKEPAAPLHLQVIPKLPPVPRDVSSLTPDHAPLVRRMQAVAVDQLQAAGYEKGDSYVGFHVPLFISVPHLHMHVIAPATKILSNKRSKYQGRKRFRSADNVIKKLETWERESE